MKACVPAADADEVPSPCISVCRMSGQTGLCEGCFRTIDEIAHWRGATAEVKRMIWTAIHGRKEAAGV